MECVNELKSIFPEQIFDVHAHIYRQRDLNLDMPSHALPEVSDVSIDHWKTHLSEQLGGVSPAGGLFCPYPSPNCDIDAANNWLIDELKKHPQSRGLLLISPGSGISKIKKLLENPQIAGFKPYYFYAEGRGDPAPAVDEYLPEWAWQLADDRGLISLVHLVRDRAMADKDNARQLRRNCLNYPKARIILAHAGRGFHAANTVKGVKMLSGVQNVYFDNSAICEPLALFAILNEFGPGKLMWGTDFPISEMPGRCVSVGNGFLWLDSGLIEWEKQSCIPNAVGVESIKALKEAGDYFGLNKADYQNIFCDNAMKLLGIKTAESDLAARLYTHAKDIIPTGTQLVSKRPERYAPGIWPAYFSEARGCETWDIDGKHYYDMSTNGIGACLLGFRDPDVTRAVQRRINLGSMSSLNPPEEVELADMLCGLHPWAGQVRFARGGGDSAAVAIRIARATTERSLIAVCGYHGWHDWYLAVNLGETKALDGHLLPGLDPLGVPRELQGTVVAFRDQSREEFEAIIRKYGDKLAAVIMEPARHHDPESGFLEFVRDGAHKCGAMLIFDEITIGFRLNIGGIHMKLGVYPDIAIFAKALGNGHPVGAVVGTTESMKGAHGSFISSTYWTESVGSVAAIATLNKMQSLPDFNGHLARMGSLVQEYWREYGVKYDLPVDVEDGYPALATFKFRHELGPELMTLYTQLMLEKGFLAGSVIYTTMGHTEEIMRLYGQAIDAVFADISGFLGAGKVKEAIKGSVARDGFGRLTR